MTGWRSEYGQSNLRKKRYLAHRIAFLLTHGGFPSKGCACHHCDNPACCNPFHLFDGTLQDNLSDMRAKGRGGHGGAEGEKNRHAKLSATQVQEMRRLYGSGRYSEKALGALFGIGKSQAHNIISGKQWGHLLEE
jgi:hypothetical protein